MSGLHDFSDDACAGKAAFLAWLAWHLDDRFLTRFLNEATR